jgi:hypothetical protein
MVLEHRLGRRWSWCRITVEARSRGGEGKPRVVRRAMVPEHRQGDKRRWWRETMGSGASRGARELLRQEVVVVNGNHGRRGESWHWGTVEVRGVVAEGMAW